MKLASMFVALLMLPAAGDIFADMQIRHRPVSASEDQLTTVRIRLEHEKVPRIVAHFIGLATGKRAWVDPNTGAVREGVPYYDGLIFHRLIHNFVIQGGDPLGTGSGGPGYVVQDQFDQTLRHSGRYFLSCAKSSNPNTFGSQFFITLAATPHLDDKHPVFGEVVNVSGADSSSRDFIDALTSSTEYPTGAGDLPVNPITIVSVTFSGEDYAEFDINDPSHRLPYIVAQSPAVSYTSSSEAGSIMTASFDRKGSFNYKAFVSSDLENWTSQRNVLSLDDSDGFELEIPDVPLKYFYRQVAIDYTQIYNPDPSILSNGAKLRFQSANGDYLTLTSDGAGAGTWVDEDGTSGNLIGFTLSDAAPADGVFVTVRDQSEFIPLINLSAEFDGPAGSAGYTAMAGLLSFHSETVGGFEGRVLQGSVLNYNRPFIFTPAP